MDKPLAREFPGVRYIPGHLAAGPAGTAPSNPLRGGREPGKPGRGVEKKTPVAVAIELDDEARPRRIAMAGLPRVDAKSLTRFTLKHAAKNFHLRTDGWGSHRSLAKEGYKHKVIGDERRQE